MSVFESWKFFTMNGVFPKYVQECLTANRENVIINLNLRIYNTLPDTYVDLDHQYGYKGENLKHVLLANNEKLLFIF